MRKSSGYTPSGRNIRSALWVLFAFLAVGVGVYPVLYFVIDMSGGLLGTKSDALIYNQAWRIPFYMHIVFGGIGLLIGWTQFIDRFRQKSIQAHRAIGKIYVTACLVSGFAGLTIAFHATGGLVAQLGFGMLAVLWLFSTTKAWLSIRAKNISSHRAWMVRSYALTFAAVTLRLWLPLLDFAMGMDFVPAYRAAAWLCWIPNLLVAEIFVRRYLLDFQGEKLIQTFTNTYKRQ